MTGWSGGIAEWIEGQVAYLSVVFSWSLHAAYQRAVWLSAQGYQVIAGGPAVCMSPEYLDDVAMIGENYPGAIEHHNPQATFTTRGCVRRCPFCIVPKIEPEYIELDDWPVKPVVCDNNFLAASRAHFDSVIDKLKPLRGIDFNQGLDARLMTPYHARRITELNMKVIRLAWDHIGIEKQYLQAFRTLRDAGIPAYKIQSYVLIGYNDTPEDALYRLETVKRLGARPNPMRYQPLNSLRRNDYISPNWTDRQLKTYMRYWSRQNWLSNVPFEEYCRV